MRTGYFAILKKQPGQVSTSVISRASLLVAMTLLLATVWGMVSCSSGNRSERIIAVSIQPQRYLLEKIVGERFKVVCLLSQGSNPEAYEPSMTHLMNLEKSEAYFCIGNIGFELAILEKARTEHPELRVFDNSYSVDVIRGGHDVAEHEGHVHEVDPHIWTSVKNAEIIASNMLSAVVELDAENAEEYRANFSRLKAELDALDKEVAARLDTLQVRTFLVWHPSLSYFARDYGLRQLSMEYNGKEAPVAHLKAEIDEARNSGARIFFYQKEFDGRQIESVNSQIGAKMVTINPMNYEWDVEIRNIANALTSK